MNDSCSSEIKIVSNFVVYIFPITQNIHSNLKLKSEKSERTFPIYIFWSYCYLGPIAAEWFEINKRQRGGKRVGTHSLEYLVKNWEETSVQHSSEVVLVINARDMICDDELERVSSEVVCKTYREPLR